MVTFIVDALDILTANMVPLVVFALSVWIAYLTIQKAKERGRSANAWMWLSIIFGPLAWLAVVLLPPLRKEKTA
jgi:hypothetical protein